MTPGSKRRPGMNVFGQHGLERSGCRHMAPGIKEGLERISLDNTAWEDLVVDM